MSNTGNVSLGKMTSSGRVSSKVGQLLQDARHQRGLEIKDIAASTHVRSEYLSALEEGRFSELPENVYTRNFLRLYAEAVGLDEQEVLEHYSLERYGKSDAPRKSVYPSPAYDAKTESYVSGTDAEAEKLTKKRRGIGWLAPLLALALLGLGAFYTWQNHVFPNDETGGYTWSVPFLDREVNLPSFGRNASTNNGGAGGTQGITTTPDTTTTTTGIDNAGTESADAADLALSETATDATTSEGTEVSTATTSEATSTDGADASQTGTDTSDTSTGTVVDAEGNASEGQLITPSVGSDGSSESADGAEVAGADLAGTATSTSDATSASNAAGILFSIITEPAGAEVNVDNFYLGTTPISEFPLTPSADKELRISLSGYDTVRQSFDGTETQEFVFTLSESSASSGDITDVEGDATTVDSITISSDGTVIATDDPSITPAAELQGKAVITIEDGGEAWLEVYGGTTRSGDPLVYRVANDSDRFEFDMPVVIRAGRSSLVQVSVNGGLAKPLGPVDEVAQQLFDE